jgi:hypothetical protein
MDKWVTNVRQWNKTSLAKFNAAANGNGPSAAIPVDHAVRHWDHEYQ